MKKNILVLSLLIIVAALTRIVPHSYNFTPIAGMALVGSAYFHRKILAFLIPVLALYVSDFILNNTIYSSFYPDNAGLIFITDFMIFTYGAMLLTVLLGIKMLRKVSGTRILGSAVIASLIFFLISNFGVWLTTPMYPKSLVGLGESYIAGLPFLQGTLLSNVIFTPVIFFAYQMITRQKLSKVLKS